MIDVSIIVPVYNAEKTIEKCLKSVFTQENCSWQVICVDDGSMDASAEIVQKYADADKRIVLINNQENLGAAASRNIAMSRADGNYIMNLDADDYLRPNCLSTLLQYAESRDVDVCFYKAAFIFMDEKANRNIPRGIVKDYVGTYSGEDLFDIFLENEEFFYYCAMALYKRVYLETQRLRYKNLMAGEGGDFIIRALLHADRAAVYSIPVYNYCIHTGSVTNSESYNLHLLAGQFTQYISMLESIRDKYRPVAEKFLLRQRRLISGGIAELEHEKLIMLRKQLPNVYAKMIFDAFVAYKDAYHVFFSAEDVQKLTKFRHIYLYGAGYAATECICRLSSMGICLSGIVVSQSSAKKKILYGHEVVPLRKISTDKNQSLFVICANSKFSKDIIALLQEHGFFAFIDLNIRV